jgi:hypothetical protein
MPTEEEIAALLQQYYADEKAKYGLVPEEMQANNQSAAPAVNIPLGGGVSVNPTLGYQNGMVVPGLEARGDDLSGYANVGMGGLTPQAVNAGISGDRGNLNANIPLSNPAGFNIRGEMDLDTKRKVALALELTPMESAVYLGVNIPL